MTVRASIRRVFGAAAFVSLTTLASSASAESTTAPPAPATPSGETSAAPAAATTTEPPAAAGSHRTAWPWILMGTGVALVVTAAVLQVGAVREDDKRESDEGKLSNLFTLPASDPQRKALAASIEDHDDKAKSARTAALIVGTVGFLTIAGSVVLWFYEGGSSEPSKSANDAPKPLKPRLLPSFGPSYAGASLGASF